MAGSGEGGLMQISWKERKKRTEAVSLKIIISNIQLLVIKSRVLWKWVITKGKKGKDQWRYEGKVAKSTA